MTTLIVRQILVSACLGVIGLLAIQPSPVIADESTGRIEPNTDVPLNFPALTQVLEVSERFWYSRGITLPPLAGVYELPHEPQYEADGGFAELPGDRIWIAGWVLENLRSPFLRTSSRATLCYVVLHERGHNAGLYHSDAEYFPIMAIPDQVGASYWQKPTAPRCWAWAEHPIRNYAASRANK